MQQSMPQVVRARWSRVTIGVALTGALIAASFFASSPAGALDYVIQPGDSLWSIAAANDTSVDELRRLNDLDGDLVRVGTTLVLPNPPYEGPVVDYVVQPGDALSVISENFGVPVHQILAVNNLANANSIRSGFVLQIPAEGEVLVSEADDGIRITLFHKVKSGEVLGVIAEEYGVSVASIMAGNDMSDPNLVRLGDVLEIRGVVPRNETERLTAIFEKWAGANDVPVNLVKAVGWQESRWKADALSSSGAMGIGQVMPGTSAFIQSELIGVTDLDPWNANDNIRMSARYIAYLLERHDGDVPLALGSYYQGPGSVERRGFYAETDDYVASVLRFLARFDDGTLPR